MWWGGGRGTNTFSFPGKVFSTLVPFSRDSIPLPSSSILSLPSLFLLLLRLQSFQVQALTLPFSICPEAGKSEEGFDHSRSLITVDEYANKVATLTPPSCPQEHLGVEKLQWIGSRTTWEERRPEGGGLVELSQITWLFILSSSPGKALESFQIAGRAGGYRERKRS